MKGGARQNSRTAVGSDGSRMRRRPSCGNGKARRRRQRQSSTGRLQPEHQPLTPMRPREGVRRRRAAGGKRGRGRGCGCGGRGGVRGEEGRGRKRKEGGVVLPKIPTYEYGHHRHDACLTICPQCLPFVFLFLLFFILFSVFSPHNSMSKAKGGREE